MCKYVICCLVSLFFLPYINLFSQRASIDNVDFGFSHDRLVIEYDLTGNLDKEHDVMFFLWDDNYNVLLPGSVFGDIGNSVRPGASKEITWDIVQDNHLLSGKLRPRLILKDEFYGRGGSESALYSLLVPGLGGYFVANHQNMKFKPYLRTALAVSFVGFGIKASQERSRESLYSEYVNPRTNLTETKFYGYGSYSHWLFPYDHIAFLGIGAAIWIYDIIWVANKGGQNDKLRRALNNFDINYNTSHGNELSIKYNF